MLERSYKDNDITLIALLKSIIESGAPVEEWEPKLRTAFKLHAKILQLTLPKEPKNG